MKELTFNEIEQISGASALGQIIHTGAGAALGAATAIILFPAVQVAWFGLVPISLPLAGAFVGGSIGSTLYNLEQYTANLANT